MKMNTVVNQKRWNQNVNGGNIRSIGIRATWRGYIRHALLTGTAKDNFIIMCNCYRVFGKYASQLASHSWYMESSDPETK